MPSGITVHVGPASGHRFHPSSSVYQVFPSLGMFETNDNFVLVAVTDRAVDHGHAETTVFKCDKTGATEAWGGLDGGAEALPPAKRVVGRHDHAAALANLGSDGYLIVDSEDLPEIRAIGMNHAKKEASEKLALSESCAEDYASNNWGIFAAMHLVRTGKVKPLALSHNDVG